MLFHNDEILYRMERMSRKDPEDSGISFKTMNKHIAACMAGVFLPTDSLATERQDDFSLFNLNNIQYLYIKSCNITLTYFMAT